MRRARWRPETLPPPRARPQFRSGAWDDAGARGAEGSDDAARRAFIGILIGGGLATLLGSMVYSVGRYVTPPKTPDAASWMVVAGQAKDFPPNSGKVFRFGNRPGLLIRTSAGEFRAFSAVCTHLGCTVQYRPDLERIWCACHNGQFDIFGRNFAGPPPRPLEVFAVAVQGDDIIVSRKA